MELSAIRAGRLTLGVSRGLLTARHIMNRALRREGLVGNLHHRGKSLGGHIAPVGKDMPYGRVKVDLDIG